MNNNSAHRFKISIPVKPYVKHFLEINYGYPLDFTTNPQCHDYFNKLLKKPDISCDHKIPDVLSYTAAVDIMISEHDFYRYGWQLTRTNTVKFNTYFEDQVKFMMRTIVGTQISIGMPINKSIRKFQNAFNYSEDIWPFHTIYKDYYRNGYDGQIEYEQFILNIIHNLILRNLSRFQTLSEKAIEYYENNQKTRG